MIKRLSLICITLMTAAMAFGQYVVNFEGTGETKTAYASGNVTLSGISWNMTEALIGTSTSDFKNGLRSARLNGLAASSMAMLADKANGLGTVSFQYRRYGTDTQVDWKVEYSPDGGFSWTQIGAAFTAPATDVVQTFSETVNASGNVRIRIKRATETGTTNYRLNIDDITLTDWTGVTPNLVLSTTTLSGFSYIAGNGPSAEQSFTVSGTNLSSNITITAPDNYEISASGVAYFTSFSLIPSSGTVNETTVYVRLKAGLTAGTYNNEDIVISTTGATAVVSCNGIVLAPQITVSTSALTGFNYMLGMGPSAEQSFTVSGSNLTNDIVLSAPVDYELSASSEGTFTSSITLIQTNNSVATTTIFVRLKAGLPIGVYNGEIVSVASAGAASQNVVCSGSVTAGSIPLAPLAQAATSITPTSFMANWMPSDNTNNYLLDVYTGSANVAIDLFISEYVEGSSNNKYIEIFNGTGAAVDLSGYRLRLYSNGASTPSSEVLLSGSLLNGSTIVYKNSAAVLTLPAGVTATTNSAVNFNGDDAVALYKISTASNVDIFGNIGEDPGEQWGTSPLWTINTTLVRKSFVLGGVTTDPLSGFPTLATEWDYYATDTATYLGSHTFGSRAISYVPEYENLNVGNVTSYPVTGLAELTDYHYVVRAANPYGTSANSNEIDVTTTSSTAPVLVVEGTLIAFSTPQGTPSAAQSYYLSSDNLTAPVSITIPAGFELSTDGGAGYVTGSTSVTAEFNGLIYVRLTGITAGTYSGSIVHSSAGATTAYLPVSGTVTGGAIQAPTVQASNIVATPTSTTITLEWTPGNGAYRVVKINATNSFTVPADGSSPTVSTGYSGFGEQVIYNGATEYIDGSPFNGCTVTNLIPNTTYWFRVYDYNGTGLDTKYLSVTATNNPRSGTTTPTSGSGYYAGVYGYGTTLKGLLHSLIKSTHTTQYSYTNVTNQIKYTDEYPAGSGNVVEIYTGWSVPKDSYGGGTTDWNKEHTWSKSHGDFGDVAPAGTDLHHLRPCDATVNSAKSNKDFANGGTALTDNSPPTGYTGVTGCYQTENTWEPRPEDKGDVARMIMYMAVRYEGDDSNFNVDLELVDYTYTDAGTNQPLYGKLATLLQWHVQDPPDTREMQRNNRTQERQGNRNPFIDYPGYAARIWTPCPLYNSDISTTSFKGYWSTPITATDYYLQIATDSLFTNVVSAYNNLDINLVTSMVISGLTAGGTYYYRLRSWFIDDYSMWSPYLSVTLANPVVATATITPVQQLEEINLASSVLTFSVQNTTFTDGTLLTSNFILNNAPAGLSIQSVSYVNSTTATIILAFNGTDFDVNYSSFTVTVAAAEISAGYSVTSSAISILAHVEGITTIDLDGVYIKLNITPVTGAVIYRVFASSDPYGTFTEISTAGTFDPVSINIWRIEAALADRRFFRVSAIVN